MFLGGSVVASLGSEDSQVDRFTWAIFQAVLLFGGVPAAIGAALVWAAFRIRRRQ